MYVNTGDIIAALPVQSTWIKEEVNKNHFFQKSIANLFQITKKFHSDYDLE